MVIFSFSWAGSQEGKYFRKMWLLLPYRHGNLHSRAASLWEMDWRQAASPP